MRLFTRTLLQGLHDGLVEHGGMPPFPNDKLASEIFDEISAIHGLPPYLEQRLDKTAAVTLARSIAGYSEKLAAVGAVAPPARVALVKQASQRDLGERAMVVASYYMQKAADEGSLTPSGPNTLAAAASHDQIAAVDQTNRPEGRYGVPIGTTDMPVPGMIGREMAAPGAPTVGATYKGASEIQAAYALLKQAARSPEEIRALEAAENAAVAAAANPNRFIHPGLVDEAAAMDAARKYYAGALSHNPDGTARAAHTPGTFRNLDAAMPAPRQNAFDVLAGKAAPNPHAPGMLRQVADELTASPLAHARHFEHRDLGGKLKSLGAVGAQGLGALGAGYGLYRGGKALYDHFTEGKEAQVKEADTSAIWNSIKSRASQLRDGVSGAYDFAAKNREHLGDLLTMNPLDNIRAARLAHGNIANYTARGGLAQEMGLPAEATDRFALANDARLQRGLHAGAAAAQGLGGLAAAGGLAYGGKALYDHVTENGKESRASDASIDAIIQSLQEHGVDVTPEIVAAVHAELEGGGGNASGDPPPSEDAKQAAHWDAVLKAAGEGSLTPSGPNTLAAAAGHDQIAAVDKKNRPEGKYKVPVGQTQLSTAAGEIGAEKKAAEAAYWANVKQAAAEWGAYLPAAMPLEMKRTAIEKVASLPPSQREQFIRALHG